MNSKEPHHIATVSEYNKLLGVEDLHPLVSVINLEEAHPVLHQRHTFGFYVIFLKDSVACDLIYGRQRYDYQEGTIVCLAPGQVIGVEDTTGEKFQPKGWALCFDPELIRGTSLGRHIKEYTYFSYEVNEALHLSDKEREMFLDSLSKIRHEIGAASDRLSKRLITANIEILLDYCLRFYERQFVTRESINRNILSRFEYLIDDYYTSSKARKEGLPTVKYCATELCLSPGYFGDLVKKETGNSARSYIQLKVMDIAKELILDPMKSISQISYELGFQYPQHFSRLFKKVVGKTPNEYRNSRQTA